MGRRLRCLGWAIGIAMGIGICAFPMSAIAQIPSYAQPSNTSDEETLHGRIVSMSGHFALALHDDRGFLDNVQLHQGTIINPTGLALAPGMSVTIIGYNHGRIFTANEIDAPYNVSPSYVTSVVPYDYYPYSNWNAGVIVAPGYGYGGWYGGGWGYGGGWAYGGWYGGGRRCWHCGGNGDWHGRGGWHGGGGMRRAEGRGRGYRR